MKWHKSIIGEIGIVKNISKKNMNLKKAQSMTPKGARIMRSWEFLKLIDEDIESIDFLKKYEYYFTYSNERYYRAFWLGRAGYGSGFDAYVRDVGDAYYGLLVGVLVVKEAE